MTDIFDFRTSLTTYMLKIVNIFTVYLDFSKVKVPLQVYDSSFSLGLVLKKLTKITIKSQYISN